VVRDRQARRAAGAARGDDRVAEAEAFEAAEEASVGALAEGRGHVTAASGDLDLRRLDAAWRDDLHERVAVSDQVRAVREDADLRHGVGRAGLCWGDD
jgi:hypothetical protein